MERAGIVAEHALEDADTLIVRTAIEYSTSSSVVVVGSDIDLLILLIQLSEKDSQLYFHKPGTGKCPDKGFFIRCILQHLSDASEMLLFLHAMTGCDTTSALYRQGKKKVFTLLQRNRELQHQVVKVFNDPKFSTDSVSSVGKKLLLGLYGASKTTASLNILRRKLFMKAVANCPIQNKIQLAALPPTSSAAQEHSFSLFPGSIVVRSRSATN